VPLHLTSPGPLLLHGWAEGKDVRLGSLCYAWDQGTPTCVPLGGAGKGTLRLSAPGPGRHWLELRFLAPGEGTVVLDKLEVER
ncbi:MAG: hypothetical protein NZ869_08580, partial [Thermoanaerobaculum sp.]|nr:hypothetical protein [Thermoanaerobaculum sp.]MDW7967790.1 hypothetical protein [Thermoanaerobaculum sp.]